MHVHPEDPAPRRPERDPAFVNPRALLPLVRSAYRRRRLAGAVFFVTFAYAALGTFTAPRVYEARTRVLLEVQSQKVLPFQPVLESTTTRRYYTTQYALLRSRGLAQRALSRMEAGGTPMFGEPAPRRFSLRRAVFGAPARVLAWLRGSPGRDVEAARPVDETRAQSLAVSAFLGSVTVAPIRGTRLVDLGFRHNDPVVAAAAANALAASYIEYQQEERILASRDASDWLADRLAEQRAVVEASQAALQAYREQHGTLPLDAGDRILEQQLADLNAAATLAKMTRIAKEAVYTQLRSSHTDTAALDAFPAVLASGVVQQQKAEIAALERQQALLRETLGDKHPDMRDVATALALARARLDAERGRVIEAVGREYESALAEERSLVSALAQQKRNVLSMNRTAIGYRMLEREAESAGRIYGTLQARMQQTDVAAELRATNFRVVDQAEPPSAPMYPRTFRDLLSGLLMGLFLAAVAVTVAEAFDSRMRTPDDLQEQLRLAALGMVPLVRAGRADALLIGDGAPQPFTDAVRALRANLLFSMAGDGCRVLSVTSTQVGEGKSAVSVNLARALSEGGQRVLLIDADMRRPRVHEVFRVPQAPGLSEVLAGVSEPAAVLRETGPGGPVLLCAGAIPANPSELLSTRTFAEVLAAQADRFDWVVIDAPPVMAVTDAALIARCATGSLFVVGAEMTSGQTARIAVRQLEQVGARLVGAVLNRSTEDPDAYFLGPNFGPVDGRRAAAPADALRQAPDGHVLIDEAQADQR